MEYLTKSITDNIIIKYDYKDEDIIKNADLRYYSTGSGKVVMIVICKKRYRLSKYLVSAGRDECVAFINGNHLDFRRNNLQVYDSKKRGQLTTKKKPTVTGYIGVYIAQGYKGFIAKIKVKGETISWSYQDVSDAAIAADFMSIHYKSLRKRNFPDIEDSELIKIFEDISRRVGVKKSEKLSGSLQGTSKRGLSKYVGVYFDRRKINKPWYARIQKDNKTKHLGSYHSENEAAMAYNEKALELYGPNAKLNKIIFDCNSKTSS